MTKEDIQKMVVNFDIILILFTVEEDLTKLMERQPMVKHKGPLKRELQELECKAKQHIFPFPSVDITKD